MKKIIIFICGLYALIAISLVANATTLTWATEATYPPFESISPNGKIVGLDVDIAKAICNKLKYQCKFVNTPWDSLIPGLKLGKYDVIWGGMNITPAREKQVAFTQPYYKNPVMFVAKKGSGFNISKEGLNGKTIGVQLGNTMQYYLKTTYGNSITIKPYTSIQNAFMDLKNGRVDAVLSDKPVITAWLEKGNSSQFAFLGKPVTSSKYFKGGYGIAVNKTKPKLLAKINNAITSLKKDGQLAKIIQKHNI